MGCNCGGSTPRQQRTPQVVRRDRQAQPSGQRNVARPPVKREGGPGSPSYYSRAPEIDPDTPAEPDAA